MQYIQTGFRRKNAVTATVKGGKGKAAGPENWRDRREKTLLGPRSSKRKGGKGRSITPGKRSQEIYGRLQEKERLDGLAKVASEFCGSYTESAAGIVGRKEMERHFNSQRRLSTPEIGNQQGTSSNAPRSPPQIATQEEGEIRAAWRRRKSRI